MRLAAHAISANDQANDRANDQANYQDGLGSAVGSCLAAVVRTTGLAGMLLRSGVGSKWHCTREDLA